MANVVVQIAESLKSIGASAVYGPPVQVDGKDVLPVAYAQYGFGGGGDEATGGGGGGAFAVPLGVYRANAAGVVVFRPNLLPLMCALTPLVWVTGKAVARVVRERRRTS